MDRGGSHSGHWRRLFSKSTTTFARLIAMKLNILYFSWVRERVGHSQETVRTDATTVADLIVELSKRDQGYAAAFIDMSAICVAVDQELSELTTPLTDASEVAFFPPMTGG